MKVGEIFTQERTILAGTGYHYYLTLLKGGAALLDTEIIPLSGLEGGEAKQRFVFQCIRPEKIEIQFAKFRQFDLSDIIYEEVIPIEIEVSQDNKFGGWSPFADLTEDDKKVFEEAVKGLVGAGYEPLKVSRQIVNGVNYRFLCNATPIILHPQPYKALVSVYKGFTGTAHLTNIERLPE